MTYLFLYIFNWVTLASEWSAGRVRLPHNDLLSSAVISSQLNLASAKWIVDIKWLHAGFFFSESNVSLKLNENEFYWSVGLIDESIHGKFIYSFFDDRLIVRFVKQKHKNKSLVPASPRICVFPCFLNLYVNEITTVFCSCTIWSAYMIRETNGCLYVFV